MFYRYVEGICLERVYIHYANFFIRMESKKYIKRLQYFYFIIVSWN
jgi:hypothetical protein